MSKTPRPYQIEAIESAKRELESHDSTLLVLPTGLGKCLLRGTRVLMYDGRVVSVESVMAGDLLMGPDSLPRKVLSTASGRDEMFSIVPTKGEPYVVNKPHILSIFAPGSPIASNISVEEFISLPNDFQKKSRGWRSLPGEICRVREFYNFSVEPFGIGDYFGFEIDGDGLFLLGDFTVTHNTVIGSKLMTGWNNGSVLFLAHTQELVEQNAEKLAAEMGGYKPIVEMNVQGADKYTAAKGDILVVGSIQSMYTDKRLEKYKHSPFGLILIDEAHRANGASYRKVINHFRSLNPQLKVVGLTATPARSDGKALGLVFDSVAFQMSINESIQDGWLTPIQQKIVQVDGLDFSGLHRRLNEFGERDFSPNELEQIISEEKVLQEFALAIIEQAGDLPTLIFTPGVQSAHLLASILCRHRQKCADAVDGKTPKEVRAEIINRFKQRKAQFLVNCSLFVEGFDVPHCACIAMCRHTSSLGRYIQMLGRGLRPLPGIVDGLPTAAERCLGIANSAKPFCLVLDFQGNSEHKLVDVWDALGGEYDDEVIELAEREGGASANISETLEKARLLRALQMQWHRRKPIVADAVTYQAYDVDPFGPNKPIVASTKVGRGSASDAQVNLLINLGFNPESARACSKKQAGALIDKLGKERCTAKQGNLLRKYDVPLDGVGLDLAGDLIDYIAQHNWAPPVRGRALVDKVKGMSQL